MDLTQSGTSVTGSSKNGICTVTINGTVSGLTLDAALTGCGTSNAHLALNGTRFDGTGGGGAKWCGARSSVAFAAGCGFAGHWNVRINKVQGTMDITQIGSSITGNYTPGGGGSVNGGLNTSNGWIANGGWHAGAFNGPFTWYIDSGDNTFTGHYDYANQGSFEWCGWRDGQSPIATGSTCKK